MVIFLSYPMNEKSKHEQDMTRMKMRQALASQGYGSNNVIVHNGFCIEKPNAGRLYYLGHAITLMDTCDAVAFHPGWTKAKGCQVERKAAELYGLQIIDLDMEGVE